MHALAAWWPFIAIIPWLKPPVLPRRGHHLHVRSTGVCATLIDFSLSRLRTDAGHVAFFDLATDPELFQGPKGDVQVALLSAGAHLC